MPQLCHFGLSKAFVMITGTQDHLAHGKLEQGRSHLKSLNIPPHQAALIGDSLHDAQIARDLGCEGLLLCHGHQSKARLETSGWPVFGSIAQMMRVLS